MQSSDTTFSVIITRAQKQSVSMQEYFISAGHKAIVLPSIGIETVEADEVLAEELHGLKDGRFSWLVLTSPNGVKALQELLEEVRAVGVKVQEARPIGTHLGLRAPCTR